MDLQKLCPDVCMAAKQAGLFLKTEISKLQLADIVSKGENDFVTYVDKQSEIMIVEALTAVLPEAGFLTEENTKHKEGCEFTWVIDPLDGTTNYIHGVPLYSVSLALMHHQRLVLGVIYEPNLDECFYAWSGGGAFLNGKPIKVSGVDTVKNAVLATGFPSRDYSRIDEFVALFKALMFDTHGIRRLGSAAVDLAYTACGRYEGFYEYGLSPWDVAAGAVIVEEAGGRVTDFCNGRDFLFGREIVATNGALHDEFSSILSKYFSGCADQNKPIY